MLALVPPLPLRAMADKPLEGCVSDSIVKQRADMRPRCRGAMRPSFASMATLQNNKRAQGKPDARCTRGLVCTECTKNRTRAYRSSGGNPAFPVQWVTAYSALSLVTGLSCHHRHADRSTQLDTSVGVSGPHGFTVRHSSIRHSPPSRPPHPTARS